MPRFVPIEVKLSADVVDVVKREVTFYGSAFANRDAQGHRVLPNAFSKTIREQLPRGEVKHYRDHKTNIGPMRELVQDSYGLLCTGYCSKTRAGDEYLEQALDGTLTHASIYGRIVRERAEWVTEKDATGENIETLNIGEIILYEAGLVDLRPANNLATLVAVKRLGDDGFLDTLLELDYIVKSFALSRDGERPTAEERRVAKALLSLRGVLGEQEEALKALLAPGDITSTISGSTPSLATPANAETQPDLTAILKSIQGRGRITL